MTKGLFKRSVNRSVAGNVVVFIFVFLMACFMILPIVYAVGSAFKPLDEIYIFPPRMIAHRPTLDNFLQLSLLTGTFWVPLSKYLFNSIFVTLAGTVGHIVLASMAAYPLAKHQFYGRRALSQVIVLSLLFTASVTYIPQYVVLGATRLIDTYWAVILIALQSSLGLYLMMNFMQRIPDEMLEAARIDGAKEIRIFWTVVMPNVKPAWLTLAIFSFQGLWNSTNSTYIYAEELKTFPYALNQIVSGGIARAGAGAAVGVVMLVVPVVFFIFSQNRIIETMSTSGMKE